MLSRRSFFGSMSLAAAAMSLRPAFGWAGLPPQSPAVDYTQWVKVAIGTGGHGHTYPGATVPFGAVQLGPGTGSSDWDHCSGYHESDSSILGFSHTHLSGTGVGDMMDILLMPATENFKFDPKSKPDSKTSFRSPFFHAG